MSDNSKNHNALNPTIVAALIGAIATVIAALIGFSSGKSTVVIQDSLHYQESTQENTSDISSFNSSDVLKENQRLQSECERLTARVAELEKRVPFSASTAGKTSISSLHIMSDNLHESDGGLKDTLGRDYSDAQTYIRAHGGSIEYLLDGQYTTLEGCYAAGDGFSRNGTSTISIYLDDNDNPYKKITIDYKTEKATFSLDLKKAKFLKIEIKSNSYNDTYYGDCLLIDWVVS